VDQDFTHILKRASYYNYSIFYQHHALIKIQQNTLHIGYQLVHVLAPSQHSQAVSKTEDHMSNMYFRCYSPSFLSQKL